MKFTSILRLSPELRSNVVFCLFFAVFCSLQSIISSVTLLPVDKVKTIWNTQSAYITCKMDNNVGGQDGVVQWFRGTNTETPIDDNSRAPVYVRGNSKSLKLFLVNPSKKYSGIYECRHIKDRKVISSNKFELKIYNAIDMSDTRESYLGTEGHEFSMPCFARFDPESTDATVSWRHNNHAIEKNDPQFSVNNRLQQSVDMKKIHSTLTIKRLSKDHEGVYVCQADYANAYMTDVKEVEINLRVQFKPRFLEKNHKNVWVSNISDGEIAVNVTCMVNADPVATFKWKTHDDIEILQNPIPGRYVDRMPDYTILNTENISVMSLKYSDITQVSDQNGKRKNFKCIASNKIGDAKQDFVINIGSLPDPPVLGHTSYENGALWLSLNQTEVRPPIDMYRVDIDNNIPIYFNESFRVEAANTTYKIDVNVPSGTHQLSLYAHNPVGWSESNNPITAHKLVISGSSVVQQYLVSVLMASALALRYTL